jgi:copper(I)-binding protein
MFRMLSAAALAASLAVAAAAHHDGTAHHGIHITDPFARVSGPAAQSGAVFMVIENHGTADDRLVAAASAIAERVELHTHREEAGGVMRMIEVPEGFAIPAGGSHALAPGGDHVMLLGLRRSLAHGDTVPLTLTFARGEVITLEVPVDLERRPAHGGGHHQHGGQHGGQTQGY